MKKFKSYKKGRREVFYSRDPPPTPYSIHAHGVLLFRGNHWINSLKETVVKVIPGVQKLTTELKNL